MSIEAIGWAWRVTTGDPTRKLVLLALANCASAQDGGQHACWPSQKYVAEFAEICERSVRSHLKVLEADGYIVRRRRTTKDGARTSDMITLLVPPPDVLPEPAERPKQGTLYALLDAKEGRVNLGFTSQDVADRQRAVELQVGRSLKLLGTAPGSRRDERGWHRAFSGERLSGAWFAASDAVLAWPSGSGLPMHSQAQNGHPSGSGLPVNRNSLQLGMEKGEEQQLKSVDTPGRAAKDNLPPDFPPELVEHARAAFKILREVARQHAAAEPCVLSLGRVIAGRPRKPIVVAAHDWAAWAASPPRPIKDVVGSYRRWLDREADLASVERMPGARRNGNGNGHGPRDLTEKRLREALGE